MEGGIRNSFSLHQHFGENEAGVECLGTLERKRDVRGVNFEFSHFFSMLEAIPFLFLHLHFQRVISKNIGFKHEPDARA